MKVRKKPIVLDAERWLGDIESLDEIERLMGKKFSSEDRMKFLIEEQVLIPTLEGPLIATLGDYVIKGVAGECYPCKPDIFEKTYDILSV